MTEIMQQFEEDRRRMRSEVLLRSVLHTLRDTVELQGLSPDTETDMVRPVFTDASANIVAQLVEAVMILEEIIFASDGCMGHRHCAHSMEPWQRARALLAGKWQAYEDRTPWPSVPRSTP